MQATGLAMVVPTCEACTPTGTFVATNRPCVSTGGEAGPDGEVPWQKVQLVCQAVPP